MLNLFMLLISLGFFVHFVLLQQKLPSTNDADWKDREAAVLAIGAVAEGCIVGLYPLLPEVIRLAIYWG